MNSREFQERLRRRATRVGIAVSDDLAARLEGYLRLLEVWNRKINLTGFDLAEPTPETIDRLLVEPLVAARHVPPSVRRMMDIGSGGGSPAIPMALATPALTLTMVESKTRKAVFLKEAVRAVGLEADVLASRHEELLSRPDLHEAVDLLTLRAVRIESKLLSNLQAFVKPRGFLFLFRSATGTHAPEIFQPPLAWMATFPLVESLRSRLVVLEKRPVGHVRST